MTDHPDAPRFPRVEAYLSRLPDGLASHPGAQVKASLIRGALSRHRVRDVEGLPAPVAQLLLHPPPSAVWVPEVHHTAAVLAIADTHYPADDAGVLLWVRRDYEALLRSPAYRTLSSFASPRLLLGAARLAWKVLHRGTTLSIRHLEPGRVAAVLDFPVHLVPPLMCESLVPAFELCLRGARASQADVRMVEVGPTRARYEGVWG